MTPIRKFSTILTLFLITVLNAGLRLATFGISAVAELLVLCIHCSLVISSLAVNRDVRIKKIFGALTKDTYQDICKYFDIWTVEEQISARKSRFNLRYCASQSAVCQTISKLK